MTRQQAGVSAPLREALQWCLNHTKGHEVNCNLNQQNQWDEAQQALSDCANTPEVRQGEGEAISIAQAEINVKRNQCTCGYWEGLQRAEAALVVSADVRQAAYHDCLTIVRSFKGPIAERIQAAIVSTANDAALATATPEQAVERCPTCTSSVRTIKAGLAYGKLEPGDCNDKWHDPPQAASGGTLINKWKIAEQIYGQLPDYVAEQINFVDFRFKVADVIDAALAAHDQKVRAEVIEQAAIYAEQEADKVPGCDSDWPRRIGNAIRALGRPAPAASKPAQREAE